MDAEAVGGIIGGLIALCIVVPAFFLVSKYRKVESVIAKKPTDLISYSINDTVENIWKAIQWFEPARLKVDYQDEAQGLIVLGESMGMTKFHNGFWLMIYLSKAQNGSTNVEIGIKSKVYQAPFALRIIRNKIAKRLHQALTVESGAKAQPSR
jgi:hypothetical protein